MMALASNRTLILDAQNWRYVPSIKSANARWNLVFKPLSNSCILNGSYSPKQWSQNSKAKVIKIFDCYHECSFLEASCLNDKMMRDK